MSVAVSFVPLADAAPAEAVVVIDVLRAFTLVPWLYERGADRVLAVANREEALALRADVLPDALLAGEHGGRPYPDFDLGNSPSEVRALDLTGRTVVHRTSAGTQGLARTVGSGTVFAASFLTAAATTRHLRALAPASVTFVITGASLGRDGDEDLACAELIAARLGATTRTRRATSPGWRRPTPDAPSRPTGRTGRRRRTSPWPASSTGSTSRLRGRPGRRAVGARGHPQPLTAQPTLGYGRHMSPDRSSSTLPATLGACEPAADERPSPPRPTTTPSRPSPRRSAIPPGSGSCGCSPSAGLHHPRRRRGAAPGAVHGLRAPADPPRGRPVQASTADGRSAYCVAPAGLALLKAGVADL
jgi:2-phosphosulfolactate phosphatase